MADSAEHDNQKEHAEETEPVQTEEVISAEQSSISDGLEDKKVSGALWYVLRVAVNRETMVKKLLVRKIEEEGLADEIVRVCVPTEKVKRVRGNTHRVTERKLYPGYVFIEMCMAENGTCPERSWFMFKETTGVGDFIGSEGRPSEMSPAEVSKMLGQVEEAEASPAIQMEFQKDDQIKVKGGAFEGYEGTVESIDKEKGTVRVLVSIFGRETPLDIEYWQLEKL
jgi:transcriptional antiterminator NusG